MLRSESISLRAVEPGDVDFLFKIENDSSNWKVSGTRVPYSYKTLEDYANSIHDLSIQKQFRFVICNNESPVGLIDLFDYDAINARSGVGIVVDANSQNNGVGSKSLKLIIEYVKSKLGLKQLHCTIQESNHKSVNLFTNLGFVQVGRRKDWYFHDNTWEDELLYQIILR